MNLTVKNIETAKNNFNKMQDRLKNPTNFLNMIAGMAYKDVMQHFSDEAGPKKDWTKWNRRDPKTKKRTFFDSRPSGTGRDKLLQDTGTLRNSIGFTGSKKTAKVYTKLGYAKYHEFGTKKMVARPFMYLSRAMKKKIVILFKAFIVK